MSIATGALRALTGAAALAALASQAQQPPQFTTEELIVTGARVPQRLDQSLRAVTVITAEDLARAGQLTLAEVLQQLGGLEIAANGGPGNPSAVFMRGANAAHTLVLVDGIRMQSATNGTTAFENIPLAEIERIEIVAGPGSSLYGSDAIGGVIQVFTRGRRATPTSEVRAAAGTQGTYAASASTRGATGATDFTLTAGALRTRGFDVTRPDISFDRHDPDDDGYRNRHFSAKVAHALAGGHQLGASLMHSDGDAEFDNGPGKDNHTRQKLTVVSGELRNPFTASWESLLRAGASRDDSTSFGDGAPARFRTDQRQATWQNTLSLGLARIVAGAEYVEQEIATTTAYAVRRRTIASLFAGVDAQHGAHALQASVRRDDNSQFGQPTTGTASYGLRLASHVRVRAGYGTAFHAPSFNDLYFPGFGNAALRPERSSNREAGVDVEGAGLRLSATYFDNRIRDLIAFSFNPVTQVFGPENLARARIRGTELSFAAALAGFDVRAKLTLQDPESEPGGAQLQRRARRHGSLDVARSFGAWRVGIEAAGSGERFDSANEAPASRLAGYGVVNVTAGYAISPEWRVDLRWNNVADRDYQLVQGFNPPGSNALATLRWTPRR